MAGHLPLRGGANTVSFAPGFTRFGQGLDHANRSEARISPQRFRWLLLPVALLLGTLRGDESTPLAPTKPAARDSAEVSPSKLAPQGPFKVRVAVLDNFEDRDEDIDGDGHGDLTHGRTVVDHLKSQLGPHVPRVDIAEIHVPQQSVWEIQQALTRLKTSGPWKAVNLSLAVYLPIDSLAEIAGIPSMTASTLKQHQATLRQKLDSWSAQQDLSGLSTEAQSIVHLWRGPGKKLVEQLEGFGPTTAIFIGAGNSRDHINLLSLAQGPHIHVVGGVDAAGRPLGWASNSSLDTERERGEFVVTPLLNPDTNTLTGADYTGDGQADTTASELSSPRIQTGKKLCGVSLAAPRSLANYLIRDF